ncbi:hydrolase 1, exosortase A system-associated [Rheinheimera sp.]|uniref:hydrolase 1, exosortase A system-associated n=1 Tax=Rheinheimera sp. TaxID=1869214 RepID=UPI0027B9CB9D|nr:hydrolase 1, exosortase A system-associated [Rheinheimera sp.]
MLHEQALMLPVADQSLAAVLSPGSASTGLLLVVGGPQYRVGSHRQFVKLCRALATANIPSLRFDVSGMGDSGGEAHGFYQQQQDIQAAIDAFFQQQPQLKSVVLWGLCDGASAILLSLRHIKDPRIQGLVLLNPWVRQQQSYAKTMLKHYYWQRLSDKTLWLKILRGEFAFMASLKDLFSNVKKSAAITPAAALVEQSNEQNYVSHMQQSWGCFQGKVCVITSGNDLTAQEFLDLCGSESSWQQLLQQADHLHIHAANHTFSCQQWRSEVEAKTINFIQQVQQTP